MNKTPWNSIAESIVQTGSPQTLGHADALQSPCMNCEAAPCCTHLPLNSFKVTNLVELDHALYLLNFDRIELGVFSGWGLEQLLKPSMPVIWIARDSM